MESPTVIRGFLYRTAVITHEYVLCPFVAARSDRNVLCPIMTTRSDICERKKYFEGATESAKANFRLF